MDTIKTDSQVKPSTSSQPFELKNGMLNGDRSFEKSSRSSSFGPSPSKTSFSDTASEYVRNSQDFVKENPAKGVAIAAAAGLAVGSLITLAMRRRP